MFIPRTLAQDDPRRRHRAWAARLIVDGSRRAGAVPRAVGEHHGRPGEPGGRARSPRATSAPQRDATFTSESRTEEARGSRPPTRSCRSPRRSSRRPTTGRTSSSPTTRWSGGSPACSSCATRGSLDGAEVTDRLSNDAPHIPFAWRAAGGRHRHRSLGGDRRRPAARASGRSSPIRSARTSWSRPAARVRDLVTTDLEGAERELAGDLAAALRGADARSPTRRRPPSRSPRPGPRCRRSR